MTDRQHAMAIAEKLRYCDMNRDLRCARDIDWAVDWIADELLRAQASGVEWVLTLERFHENDIADACEAKAKELRAHIVGAIP